MEYLLTTIKGLEDIALKDYKRTKIIHPGKLLLKTKNINKLIYTTRSIIRVTEILASFKFKKQEDIIKKIKQTKFKINYPYRIQCFREGSHDFNSQDIMSEGHKLLKGKVDFKKPKTILAVEIIGNTCYLGYLKANELNKRFYKIKTHKTDINSCLAFLLLKLADCNQKHSLLDPYCGCGTILIEAALYAKNITPMSLRNKNKKFDKIKNPKLKLIGFDSMLYNVKNTRINAKIAKIEKDIELHQCTIDWAETKLEQNSIDRIITNLPKNQEQEFFKNIPNILAKDAIILILTINKESLLNEKEYKLIEKRTAQVGDTVYYLIKCSLKKTLSNKEEKS